MAWVYIGRTSYGDHYLEAAAAASWFRMVRDGCPAGGITDALRTQAEQEAVFRKYYTTSYAASAKFDRRVWNGLTWWRKPGAPSAATPGSPQARHQKGLSLDLNGATKAWVRANGHRYGWIKDLVTGEDWHMEYQAARDVVQVSNPGTTVGGTLPDINVNNPTPLEKGFLMALTDQQQQHLANQINDLYQRLASIDETHDWARQTTEAVGRLDAQRHTVNEIHDWTRNIAVGVGNIEGRLNSALAEGDPEQIAAILRDVLSDDLAADVASRLRITTQPEA